MLTQDGFGAGLSIDGVNQNDQQDVFGEDMSKYERIDTFKD